MTSQDWNIVLQGVLVLMTGIVIPWAIQAYQRRTGVQITDQQRAAVQSALTTAAGLIQTQLDRGFLTRADIVPDGAAVTAAAIAALDRVPTSAAAVGTTPGTAATIVASRVDTTPVSVMVAQRP